MAINFATISNFFNGSSLGALANNFATILNEFPKVIYRDGSTYMVGNLDMNSNSIINVPSPVNDSDVANLGSIRSIASSIKKGDPGGNAMAIGLFTGASTLAIPVGTDLVAVSGTSAVGDLGSGRTFSYSVSVNSDYVSANPTTSFIDINGRGFKESGTQVLAKTGTFDLSVNEKNGSSLRPIEHYITNHGREFTNLLPSFTSPSANDMYTAFMATLALCKADGCPLLIPYGNFSMGPTVANTIYVDPTRTLNGALRAIPIVGVGGPGQSVINLTNPGGGIGLQVSSTSDWFDPILEGFSVYGSYANPLMAIGKNDYSDPVNTLRIRDVTVGNSANDPANVALRLNYIAGGLAVGLIANSYAAATGSTLTSVNGTALECRQVEFMGFHGGAAGNANRSIDIKDGVNVALKFDTMTLENSNYAFSHRTPASGGHAIIACQISNNLIYPIQSTGMNGGLQAKFIACNFSTSGALVDPASCEGIWIDDRSGITTPPMPTSGTTIRNTTGHPVSVLIYGGIIDSVVTTSTGLVPNTGSASSEKYRELMPGDSIAVNYELTSGGSPVFPPTWIWTNRGG